MSSWCFRPPGGGPIPGCEGSDYCSHIVVRADDPARDLSDCAAVGVLVGLAFTAPVAAQCPKRCLGGGNNGLPCSSDLQCDNGQRECSARVSCVHLEWRPTLAAAAQGQIAEVGLYAVSSNGFDQAIQSVEVILDWDPAQIALAGFMNPCDEPSCSVSCPPNTYAWFSPFFANDCALDGVNAPCSGLPANDGDAWFAAISFCPLGGASAFATPQGLHVVSFEFEVLGPEGSESFVDMLESIGANAKTRVLGGDDPGTVVTGNIGPATRVRSQNCQPPTAVTGGCRYLNVTPPQDAATVALLVTGDVSDPDVSCVSQYVQTPFDDGNGNTTTLGPDPVFLTPAQWGTVQVRDAVIHPGKNFTVWADCGSVNAAALSDGVDAATWIWGDTDGNLDPNFQDIGRIVDGFTGTFSGTPPMTFSMADLVGGSAEFCEPDRDINFQDIAAAVDAFTGAPFSNTCAPPCP